MIALLDGTEMRQSLTDCPKAAEIVREARQPS